MVEHTGEDATEIHVALCGRFNSVGRAYSYEMLFLHDMFSYVIHGCTYCYVMTGYSFI